MSDENNSSKRIVTIRVPEWKYQKWKLKADKAGFTMNMFLIMAIDDFLDPIAKPMDPHSQELDTVNRKLDSLQKTWDSLEDQRKMLLDQASDLPQNPKLQEKILLFLEKMKIPLSEYIIAEELGEDVDIVFVVCSYLVKINKLKQTKDLKWEI